MRSVLKYSLSDLPCNTITIPGLTKLLKIERQHGRWMLWAEVESSNWSSKEVSIYTYGTGHTIPEGYKWLDTVQDGQFVWHFYTRLN